MGKNEKIENRYGCPAAMWRKFKPEQKVVYNNVRAIGKMDLMSHPTAKISIIEWQTIAHNFACIAAWEIKTTKK